MTCRAPTSATTCAGSSPAGALLTYDAERRLTVWQNAPSSPTSQAWFMEDGEGHRVEQYISGGSGNHTYYLPGNVEQVTPSGSLVKYYAAGEVSLWNLRISLRLSFPVTPHTIRRPPLIIAARKEPVKYAPPVRNTFGNWRTALAWFPTSG